MLITKDSVKASSLVGNFESVMKGDYYQMMMGVILVAIGSD